MAEGGELKLLPVPKSRPTWEQTRLESQRASTDAAESTEAARLRTSRRASRDSLNGGDVNLAGETGEPTVLPVEKRRPTWEESRRDQLTDFQQAIKIAALNAVP